MLVVVKVSATGLQAARTVGCLNSCPGRTSLGASSAPVGRRWRGMQLHKHHTHKLRAFQGRSASLRFFPHVDFTSCWEKSRATAQVRPLSFFSLLLSPLPAGRIRKAPMYSSKVAPSSSLQINKGRSGAHKHRGRK